MRRWESTLMGNSYTLTLMTDMEFLAILDSIVVFQAPMTEIEQSMVDEMSDLIKDQNEKIRKYETYIEELQQQMADMTNRVYDC